MGSHLILSGIMTEGSDYAFSLYSLDLFTMEWEILLPNSSTLCTGSWHASLYSSLENKLFIVGDKTASMNDDYSHRSMSFDHVVVVELEMFGIYQPPAQQTNVLAQKAGLKRLTSREGPSDFKLICDDGRMIPCSRVLLEERWPWLKERIRTARRPQGQAVQYSRLTPTSFDLRESYVTTWALLQYFYTNGLITPLQHTPSVRNQLLFIASSYAIPGLAELVKHAMHCDLSPSTAEEIGQIASLCGCRGLQER